MSNTTLDLTDDIIDIRDIIERYEYLEDSVLSVSAEEADCDELEEALILGKLLDELKGYGGDEQWRGDWYPVTLIRETYFAEYAEDLVRDIGDLPREIPSYIEIDWEATAKNLLGDYSDVEIDGVTYYYR